MSEQRSSNRIIQFLTDVLVDKREDHCWLWLASKSGKYGYHNGSYAHRFSFELFYGPIPDGIYVCHRCDVPACVNPEHLFLGTCQDNLVDASKKGRLKRSSETRAIIGKLKRGNKYFLGRKHTQESRKRMSEATKGKPKNYPPGYKRKKASPEARARMSAAKLGKAPWNKGKTGIPWSEKRRAAEEKRHET